jgi:hypothetical protein
VPYLSQLAHVARRTGYPVTEVPGWASRGHGPQPSVEGIVCHHTAGASGGGDYPSLAVVRDGRPGLDGPLSHFGIGRSGRIYVIAAGRCWHNAPSTSSLHTNSASIGIEAENDGRQAWPPAQLDAYRRLVAELCREFGLDASRVKGHKEVNTAKPDPHHVDMDTFRAAVARLIKGEDDVSAEDVWNYGIDTGDGGKPWRAGTVLGHLEKAQDETNAKLDKVLAALAARSEVDVDEQEIVRGVLAGLPAEAIAAAVVEALPADVAQQVVEGIGARLSNESPEG